MLSMFVESNADPDCDFLVRWVILRLDIMPLLDPFVTERMMTIEMMVRRIPEGFSDRKKKRCRNDWLKYLEALQLPADSTRVVVAVFAISLYSLIKDWSDESSWRVVL